jgi:hypothetical protein
VVLATGGTVGVKLTLFGPTSADPQAASHPASAAKRANHVNGVRVMSLSFPSGTRFALQPNSFLQLLPRCFNQPIKLFQATRCARLLTKDIQI